MHTVNHVGVKLQGSSRHCRLWNTVLKEWPLLVLVNSVGVFNALWLSRFEVFTGWLEERAQASDWPLLSASCWCFRLEGKHVVIVKITYTKCRAISHWAVLEGLSDCFYISMTQAKSFSSISWISEWKWWGFTFLLSRQRLHTYQPPLFLSHSLISLILCLSLSFTLLLSGNETVL